MKKAVLLISILSLIFVSCEKEADKEDFISEQRLDILQILNRGDEDPLSGLLIDRITGGVINRETGIITDPVTGKVIDPESNRIVGGSENSGIGLIAAVINGKDFILTGILAELRNNILTIRLQGEGESGIITLVIENPETRAYDVKIDDNYIARVKTDDKLFSTKSSLSATGVLNLTFNNNNNRVSGIFEITPFFLPQESSVASESLDVTNGVFNDVEVVNR